MNIGVETEKIEFKKTTGELREGITSLASMARKMGNNKTDGRSNLYPHRGQRNGI